ncbi:penicillin-binding transpeptidase domain-containing protein [Lentibacillus sediminis]|uniref:penicillin-binding transpeptidase domain-containing protein n=1 Tax=Lentibacillus sediminis TaxID=1940529 RepID=UPI000C1C64E4|nr:penicillin-binding transpeptidase domain-containing protein [Lentibacillus sediminis]
MRKAILLFLGLLILFLTACSEDLPTPNERFGAFVEQWNNQEFAGMYEMLSGEAQDTFSTEEMANRYSNMYEDLDVSELRVSFNELSEEETTAAMEGGTVEIPFHVEMQTIAGPISFNYQASLVQESAGEDAEPNWFVEWNTGYIFPELQGGGEVSLNTQEPERGEIFDRNQMPLALNGMVNQLGIVPGKLGDNPDQAKEEIAGLLNMSVEEIDTALNASWVEPELLVPITTISQNNQELVDQLLQVSGVSISEVPGRVYPAGEAAGPLVGYLNQVTAEDLEELDAGEYGPNDMIGARGLEQLYEEQLRGERGVEIVVTNEEETSVIAEKPVQDGEDITLTIDINMQEKVYEAYGGDAGTATVMDPKTGETLALVSSPSFDPNEIMYGTTENLWEELNNDEQQPLLNRFAATYAPGSVIKPVTAAIGLQNGTIDPNEGIEINGLTWSGGEGWGDYEVTRVSESNGPVDLHDALVRSDNIYFAMQALEMGSESLISGFQQFGVGEELPYEYPIENSTISADGTIEDEVLLANTSYGQGQLEMSALHLATTYTTFLNDGNMLKPTLLTSEETGQVWQEGLATPEQSELIRDALRAVVTDGTAPQAQEADFPISAKTGTAELKLTVDDESGEINSWFVGYPTEDQDLLLSMMVEQTQDEESGYAVEKATDILIELKQ